MAIGFAFDGGAAMTTQPSELEVTPAAATETQTIDGGYVATPRSKGAEIRVSWGVGAAKTAVMAELRSARGATVAHSIQFNDVTGTGHNYKVNWLSLPAFRIQPGYVYDRITITFHERAD